jgi:hypothetical protein
MGKCQEKFHRYEQRLKDAGLHLEANDSRLCQNNAKTNAGMGR